MNDLTIDLSNTPTIAPRYAQPTDQPDPWTEEISAAGDFVTFTLDGTHAVPDGTISRYGVHFGVGFRHLTLEAARGALRTMLVSTAGTEDERLDRDVEYARQEERASVTEYAVMRSVCTKPGMNFRALAEHLRERGWTGKDQEIRDAVTELQTGVLYADEPPLSTEKGVRNSTLHYPAQGQTPELWTEEQRELNVNGIGEDDVLDEDEL